MKQLLKTLKEKLLIILFVLGGFFVFHRFFEFVFNKTTVFFFSYLVRHWITDILFVLLSLYPLFEAYKAWKRKQKYVPSVDIIILFVGISIIYSFYRFGNFVWDFIPLYSYPALKYADALLIFTGLNLVLLFVSDAWKKQTDKNEQIGFFNDEPLNSQPANLIQNADEFGYANYARIISEKIEATHLNIMYPNFWTIS